MAKDFSSFQVAVQVLPPFNLLEVTILVPCKIEDFQIDKSVSGLFLMGPTRCLSLCAA